MTGSRGNDECETTLWHGQAHMPSVKRAPTVIARGDGAYLHTEDGRRLLDLPGSLWYCTIGHGRREIADAIAAQVTRIEAYSNFQEYATRPAMELAERLAALAPIERPKVYLGSGGSDAVEVAAKLARRYWGVVGRPDKRVIVSRTRCYHGLHGFGTSLAGLEPNRTGYGELMPDTARVAHDDWRAFEAYVREEGADRVAAFFCEPIIGTGGVLLPEDDYLRQVQRICRENDILFVVDEVICGFGRTGSMFACERFGLAPDLLLFAKGATSGYLPLGGVLVAPRVWEPFWADDSELVFRHGLTYQAHATVCAAALATLDVLEREQLVARVRSLEAPLEQALRPLAGHEAVREVRTGIGLLGAVQLHDAEGATEVVSGCRERGILTRTIGDGAALHVCPPFVVTAEELAHAAAVIADALDRVPVGAPAA